MGSGERWGGQRLWVRVGEGVCVGVVVGVCVRVCVCVSVCVRVCVCVCICGRAKGERLEGVWEEGRVRIMRAREWGGSLMIWCAPCQQLRGSTGGGRGLGESP